MKTKIFLLTAAVVMLLAGNINAQNKNAKWQKANAPVWQGKKDTTVYWYTLDAEGKLALTTDNQKWVIATQPQWNDDEGKIYKIEGVSLMMSKDTGKTWTKATNRFWRGSDGMWYGFDDNWTLWTGGNGNNPPLGIVGNSNPYGGTDSNTGVNANGETTGINNNDNTKSNTNIVTPNATNTNSGGTVSGAQRNNEGNGRSSGNTGGGNTNTLPPK